MAKPSHPVFEHLNRISISDRFTSTASRREFFRNGGKMLLGGLIGSSALTAWACEKGPAERLIAPESPRFDHGGGHPTRTVVEVFYPQGNDWDALAKAIKKARDCSNLYGHGAGAVGLTRGSTYDYSSGSTLNHPNGYPDYQFGYDAAGISFIAVGAGDRPILKTSTLNYISVRNYDYFEDLSIRGPYYGKALYLRDVDPKHGLNGSGQSHFKIANCEVSGFTSYGIQGGSAKEPHGSNNRIEYCHVHRNGLSSRANVDKYGNSYGAGGIYMGKASHCHVDRNTVEWNATNGIDTNGSYTEIYNNICRHNGWTNDPMGDNKGITVFGALVHTRVTSNTCSDNTGDGISISLNPDLDCPSPPARIEDVEVKRNTCENNGGNGISVGSWNCSENIRCNVFGNTCSYNGRWGTELLGNGKVIDANIHWNKWTYRRGESSGCFRVSVDATYKYNDNTCTAESEPCEPEDPTKLQCEN